MPINKLPPNYDPIKDLGFNTDEELEAWMLTTEKRLSNKTAKVLLNQSTNSQRWLLDSGCTDHMCGNNIDMHNEVSISPIRIRLGNNKTIISKSMGDVILYIRHPDCPNGKKVTLKNVLRVPEIVVNLVSVSAIENTGCSVTFNKG